MTQFERVPEVLTRRLNGARRCVAKRASPDCRTVLLPMIVALAMLFGMNICTGAMQPLINSWFNEQIESGNRATLLSFNSTIATMGGAVGLLLGGHIADVSGIPFEWQIAGLISACAAPVYWAIKRRESGSVALASTAD